MEHSRLPTLSDSFALYEMTTDMAEIKRYFVYNMKTGDLIELIEEDYLEYRQQGAWPNLARDEEHLNYLIDLMRRVGDGIEGFNCVRPERTTDGRSTLNFKGFADTPEMLFGRERVNNEKKRFYIR